MNKLLIANKLNKYLFILYVAITTIILILLKFDVISYGPDITNALMPIIFLGIMLLIFFLRWVMFKLKGNAYVFFLLITTGLMFFMIGYYFLEDGFRIT